MELEKYLKKQRITQNSFAKLIGISTVHANRLVRGKRLPSITVVKRITKATNGMVTLEDFKTEDTVE